MAIRLLSSETIDGNITVSGTAVVGNTLYLAEYIQHTGNTNNNIRFQTNRMQLFANFGTAGYIDLHDNGNVYIGASNATALTITSSSATFAGSLTGTSATFSGNVTSAGTIFASNNSPAYSFSSDTNTGIARTGTHQMGFLNNNSTSLTLAADLSATFAGNITSTATSFLLNFNVTDNSTFFNIDHTGNEAWAFKCESIGGGTADFITIGASGGGKVAFGEDGGAIFEGDVTISKTGNAALTITGGTTNTAKINFGDSSNDDAGIIEYTNDAGGSDIMAFTVGTIEQMRLANSLLTFPSTGVSEIRGDIGSNKFAIGNMGDASSQMMVSSRGFLTFNVSNTGSGKDATERMRIWSGGMIQIGSDSSSTPELLTVQAYTQNQAFSGKYSASGYLWFLRNEVGNSGRFQLMNAGSTTINLEGNTTRDNYILGDLGIGTTSPAARLDVRNAGQGGIELWPEGLAVAGTNLINNYDRTGDNFVDFEIRAAQYNWKIGTSSKMVMLSSGNVGIGTTSPTAKLKVIGVNDTWTCQIENTQALPYGLSVNTAGTAGTTFNSAFYTHSGTGMFIVNNGNVGIGTVSPTGKITSEAPGNHLHLRATTAATGKYWNFDVTANNQLFMITDGGLGMNITNTGNVGIGVTPTQKLDVNGQMTHDGLVMKSGTGLYVDTVTTFNITLDFVAGNWVSTGLTSVSNNGLTLGESGTYIMQIYSDDHSPGEPYWYGMYWSGIMSWYASNTNQANTQNPIVLQKAGHGDNNRSLEAQILWQTSSGTPANAGLLQLKCNATAPGTDLRLKFRRLI